MVTLPAIDMLCQSKVPLPELFTQGPQTLERKLQGLIAELSTQGLQTPERKLQKLIAEGKAKFLRGDYQGAESKYQEILKAALMRDNKELSALASAMIGAALRNQGKLRESRDYYSQATEANPSLFEAWAARGSVSFNLGDYPDAVRSLETALALRADEPGVWLLRGYALAMRGNKDTALHSLERGLGLNPGEAYGWLIHANLLTEQAQYDMALQSFERAFALRKHISVQLHEPLYYQYALALLARGIEVGSQGDLSRVQELMVRLRWLEIQGRIEGRARVVQKAVSTIKDSYPQHRKRLNAMMTMRRDPWVGWQAASYIIGEHWPKGLSAVEAVRRARR